MVVEREVHWCMLPHRLLPLLMHHLWVLEGAEVLLFFCS